MRGAARRLSAFAYGERIDGVLLAGGRSRRFGADKRLAAYRDSVLFEHALRRLRGAVSGNVFVASGSRRERLPGAARHSIVADAIPGRGPLGGIVAGLRKARRGVLVLACDVPVVAVDTLRALVRMGDRLDRPVVPRSGAGWEPLIAYYPAWALTVLEAALREGQLAPHRVLDRLGCVAATGIGMEQLRNVNRPADLETLRSPVGRDK